MTEDDKALVEELREDGYNGHNPLCLKAADRIEALAVKADIIRAKMVDICREWPEVEEALKEENTK